MVGDDLSVDLFLWGTAFAFGLAAVNMAGSDRILIIRGLWVGAVTFLSAALLWPLADKLPSLKSFVDGLSVNHIALNILGILIFSLLVFDFRQRSKMGSVAHGESSDEIAEIRGQIDEGTANLAAARNSMVTTFTNLALDQDKRLDSINDKIGDIEAISNKNSTKLHEIGQESPVVFEIIMEVLAHSLLFNAIPPEPELLPVSDLTPDNIERQRTIASEYFEAVRQALIGTQWEYNVRGILQQGSDMADHLVRAIPERPAAIDPLDLRQYAIFRIRCEGAGAFVRGARAEARQKYRHWLSLMKQFYEARKSRSQ